MARIRTVQAPRGELIDLGPGSSMRLISGSMGAPAATTNTPAPLGDTKFETPMDDAAMAREIARREVAEGLTPSSTFSSVAQRPVPPIQDPNILLGPEQPLFVGTTAYYRLEGDSLRYVGPNADLSSLPERFTLDIERKAAGSWVVRAPSVHVSLFVANEDLTTALANAPAALAAILALDGPVPAQKKRVRK